jgi:nuclear pore complex protein Nup98-Nup96
MPQSSLFAPRPAATTQQAPSSSLFSFSQPAATQQPSAAPSLFAQLPSATTPLATPFSQQQAATQPQTAGATQPFSFGGMTTAQPSAQPSFAFGQQPSAQQSFALGQPPSAMPLVCAESLSIRPPIPEALTTPRQPITAGTSLAVGGQSFSATAAAKPAEEPRRVNPRSSFRLAEQPPVSRRLAAIQPSAKALVVGESVKEGAPPILAEPQDDAGHYMVPPRESLRRMGFAQLSALPNFVVGRTGFGQIRFLAPVDLTKVALDDSFFGRVVVFERSRVTVYPEGGVETPPQGAGLNVRAEIRVDRCWPVTKADREPIRDISHPRVVELIERLKAVPDTEFRDYFPDTGTWIFRVKHFSSYAAPFEH